MPACPRNRGCPERGAPSGQGVHAPPGNPQSVRQQALAREFLASLLERDVSRRQHQVRRPEILDRQTLAVGMNQLDQRPVGREAVGWYFAAGELSMTPSDLAKWDISFLNKQI